MNIPSEFQLHTRDLKRKGMMTQKQTDLDQLKRLPKTTSSDEEERTNREARYLGCSYFAHLLIETIKGYRYTTPAGAVSYDPSDFVQKMARSERGIYHLNCERSHISLL